MNKNSKMFKYMALVKLEHKENKKKKSKTYENFHDDVD